MEYLQELEAIQTWIKAAAGLNSYRLKEAKAKLPRPVVLWEAPTRSKDRNLSRYQYVNKVRQYGRLFAKDLDDALDVQEKLVKDLEERGGVLPIKVSGVIQGYLKAVEVEFDTSESLDIPFNVTYEVTYGKTRPQEAPPAAKVVTKITTGY